MNDRTPQFAENVRTFILQNRHGLLATISVSQDGFPFGSIVPYDVASNGDIIIYVSLIAEHYKNLVADNRASLTTANFPAHEDPQASPRATVLLRFEKVAEADYKGVKESYEDRFPNSINYEIAHNFVFMRAAPQRIRWIAGFGQMGWVDAPAYKIAVPDPLAHASFEILRHMNEDHQDALRDCVRAFSDKNMQGGSVQMTEITANGFVVNQSANGNSARIAIPFAVPVSSPEEARSAVIHVLRDARAKISQLPGNEE